jgi:Flp pilus assembly protein TadG
VRRTERGAALLEFALAWPVVLVLVLGAVELAVWGSETFAARAAALAGARAGTVAGASASIAGAVTLRSLSPSLVGVTAASWCPGQSAGAPQVWVCATDLGNAMRVEVGGSAPAIVPVVAGNGLPLHARVVLQKEVFGT